LPYPVTGPSGDADVKSVRPLLALPDWNVYKNNSSGPLKADNRENGAVPIPSNGTDSAQSAQAKLSQNKRFFSSSSHNLFADQEMKR
jgi:hypothetical protein